MSKKIIKLTESELHNMIKEVINEINNVNDFIDNLENDYHNEVMKTYTAFVVVNNSDGSIVANFDKNELIDAVDYAKTLAQKNKYGSYVVCGCDDNDTYSDDIDDEDNSIVYSTDEKQNDNNNFNFEKHFSLNEKLNEIGDTTKGQYALGAVAGRANSKKLKLANELEKNHDTLDELNKESNTEQNAKNTAWKQRKEKLKNGTANGHSKAYYDGYKKYNNK